VRHQASYLKLPIALRDTMSERRKNPDQVALKEQNNDKLEALNQLLRDGKVGPHEFDQEFSKLWGSIVGADDQKGWNRSAKVVVHSNTNLGTE